MPFVSSSLYLLLPRGYRLTVESSTSELTRETEGWVLWLFKTGFARSTEVGSRTLVLAALQSADTHGAFFENGNVTPPSPLVSSSEEHELETQF